MKIEELGPEAAERVFSGVLELLRELEDGTVDLTALRSADVAEEWRRRPDAMRAIVASDDDGAMLGVATLTEGFALYAGGRYGVLTELYVVPGARSRRVGSALVDAIRTYGAKRGWNRIEVTTPGEPRWERTREFYERNGFTFAGPKFKTSLR